MLHACLPQLPSEVVHQELGESAQHEHSAIRHFGLLPEIYLIWACLLEVAVIANRLLRAEQARHPLREHVDDPFPGGIVVIL